MPLRKKSSEPPPVMTWMRAAPVLAVCFVFDALRFIFEQFWFFGPAFIGVATNAALHGGILGKMAGVLVGGIAAFVGGPFFVIFGVVMAMAVGLMGWMIVGLMLLLTNARLFKENAGSTLWFVFSLGISEIPFIDSLPVLTVIMARMYHSQIKKERAALKAYENEQAGLLRAEQAQQAAEIMQVRATELAQAEQQEAEEDDALYEQATNDELYDDGEIPESVRKRA